MSLNAAIKWFCAGNDKKLEAQVAALQAKQNAATIPRMVWSLDNAIRGFSWETYGPRDTRDIGDPATFDLRWGGPVVNGVPTHSDGAPTTFGVETDTRFSQAERGQDEHKLIYCIDNRDSTADLEIIDTDARAESLRVYLGCACHADLTYERYQQPTGGPNDPPYTSDGQVVATIPQGEVRVMTVLIHDPGLDFSGFWPTANFAGSEEETELISYQNKPTVSHRVIQQPFCGPEYSLQENESFTPIELTCC